MKIDIRSCKKCGNDFTTMELEFLSNCFCMMCWKHVPDHIPREQKFQYLRGNI